MTEARASDPHIAADLQPHVERHRNWRLISRNAFVFLIVGIAFYSLGRYSANQEVETYKKRNAELAGLNGKLDSEVKAAAVRMTSLQDQLNVMKAKYDEVLGPARNLEIKANESKPVSISSIEIGMVGTPMNDSVNLNINGKKQAVSAGDVVSVDFTCNMRVVSIDLLKSTTSLTSACAVKR